MTNIRGNSTVTMPGTVKKKHMIIDKYKEIVTDRYADP